MPGYITQRFSQLLSTNACSVGTTPVKISGGQAVLTITGTSGFIPNQFRQGLRICNTHGTQNLFIGSSASITNAAGGGWIKELAPGQYWEDLSNGTYLYYIVGSGAATTFTMDEAA